MFKGNINAKICATSLAIVIINQFTGAALAGDFQGGEGQTNSAEDQLMKGKSTDGPILQGAAEGAMLKGGVQFCVPHGTPLKLKIASVPSEGLELLDRDLDGNLLPARLHEVITARVSEDLYVDDNKVIPEGTVFHGEVSKILPPRRVGRPGSLVVSFDHLTRPDGVMFAFKADANNFKESTAKTKTKGTLIVAYHAAGGAVVGAMVAYKIFGFKNTMAMHGYNIAGGAAAGALLATGYALMRKGHAAVLEPGDDLNLSLDGDLLMPAAVEATAKPKSANLEGLDIKVKKTKVVEDGLDGKLLCMDVLIDNHSNRIMKSIDLFIEDTNGNRDPVCGGPEEESDYLFSVEPHSQRSARLFFQVHWPKLHHNLVWLNHDSRQICFRQAIQPKGQ